MSKLTDRITALAKPIVEEEGCSLWDVEYVREGGCWYLRLLIDKEGGLGIDDCERISRRMDPMLRVRGRLRRRGAGAEAALGFYAVYGP